MDRNSNTYINNKYFKWLVDLIDNVQGINAMDYKQLLTFLDYIEFKYFIYRDENRYEDGINLRYRFGYEKDIPNAIIVKDLDVSSCSVLEMMIALSIRCEEQIMDDPDLGNRTGKWFWGMIENLGLINMTDANYDDDYIERVICNLLDRRYECDGKGGLFTIKGCRSDLRNVEIWYQMCWYLNGIS